MLVVPEYASLAADICPGVLWIPLGRLEVVRVREPMYLTSIKNICCDLTNVLGGLKQRKTLDTSEMLSHMLRRHRYFEAELIYQTDRLCISSVTYMERFRLV